MAKEIEKDRTSLKITSMIVCGLLGALTLIGIFFGREGYIVLGIVIVVFLVLGVLFTGNSR